MNTNIPQLFSTVRLCSPCRAPQTASLDTSMFPCACKFDYCFSSAILFDNFTGMSNKEPREVTFASLCCLLCLWCELSTFFCSTIDGYSMPLMCRGGLMYLSLLENPQTRILRGTQLYTSQDSMNGILLSWTLVTHLLMESLLVPMTPLRGLLLTLALTNLWITHIEQSKLSISWMTHPN